VDDRRAENSVEWIIIEWSKTSSSRVTRAAGGGGDHTKLLGHPHPTPHHLNSLAFVNSQVQSRETEWPPHRILERVVDLARASSPQFRQAGIGPCFGGPELSSTSLL